MTVNIVFVKNENGVRTEIPYDSMTEDEKKEQAEKLAIRFMDTLGYQPVTTTA